MSLTHPFRFAVVLLGEDTASTFALPVEHSFEPEYEWTRFYWQRKGELGLAANGNASSIIPIWSKAGEPYCQGYRIQIEKPEGDAVASDFPNSRFAGFADTAAARLVLEKKLREQEHFSYLLAAFPAQQEEPDGGGFSVVDISPALPVQESSLQGFLACAAPSGVIHDDDVPVFVSRQVLDCAAEQTRAEAGTETGGILLGKLHRDAAAKEIFVELTAMIPAEHTIGTNVKLTFTPETWEGAEAALRLRSRGELLGGFAHSHPVFSWCGQRKCSLEKQRNCRLAKDFFSADDEAVMRAAFPCPYHVAIVVNDTAFSDLTFSMFGYRRGGIQPRGFYVLEEKTHGESRT
jgi:hypothetical protein